MAEGATASLEQDRNPDAMQNPNCIEAGEEDPKEEGWEVEVRVGSRAEVVVIGVGGEWEGVDDERWSGVLREVGLLTGGDDGGDIADVEVA